MKEFEIKNQNGRSMIEMLGVLAIIGVLSVGGIAGYSKAMMKYRINKTIEQITLIAGNVRTFFASQGNYGGLYSGDDTGNAIIRKTKLVPDEMLTLNTDGKITSINNEFGGNVILSDEPRNEMELSPKNTDGYAFTSFSLRFTNISSEACVELATLDWGNVSGGGLLAIVIEKDGGYYTQLDGCNGEVSEKYTAACPNGNIISIPMPVDVAVDACDCENTCLFMIQYK